LLDFIKGRFSRVRWKHAWLEALFAFDLEDFFIRVIDFYGFEKFIKVVIVIIFKGLRINKTVDAVSSPAAAGAGCNQGIRSSFTVTGKKDF